MSFQATSQNRIIHACQKTLYGGSRCQTLLLQLWCTFCSVQPVSKDSAALDSFYTCDCEWWHVIVFKKNQTLYTNVQMTSFKGMRLEGLQKYRFGLMSWSGTVRRHCLQVPAVKWRTFGRIEQSQDLYLAGILHTLQPMMLCLLSCTTVYEVSIGICQGSRFISMHWGRRWSWIVPTYFQYFQDFKANPAGHTIYTILLTLHALLNLTWHYKPQICNLLDGRRK